jgi:hypothetical protein
MGGRVSLPLRTVEFLFDLVSEFVLECWTVLEAVGVFVVRPESFGFDGRSPGA